jgi:hypothetical protein
MICPSSYLWENSSLTIDHSRADIDRHDANRQGTNHAPSAQYCGALFSLLLLTTDLSSTLYTPRSPSRSRLNRMREGYRSIGPAHQHHILSRQALGC